jgi:signal transduction histidine kinase
MDAQSISNGSLWWKLSWQLSLVFVAVVAAVITGLCIYGAVILSPNVGMQDKLATALEESLVRNRQGNVSIVEGPQLGSWSKESDRLWFVVATPDRKTVSYGPVPSAYADLAPYIYLIKDADIRGSLGSDESASIDVIETSLGEVRVMYGGHSNRTETFLMMLRKTYPIYIPLLVIALPAIFLVVPRIVRRALTGLNSVVSKAPDIDPRRAGSRLPVKDVPTEVAPLIVAFNSILERLEEQFQARQRFLIDAAHELRTPIAIMQTRIEGMEPGKERKRLIDDVARLGATAEQLLDFERGQQTADSTETVDLVEIARGVVADLAPLAIATGYEISFESGVGRSERQGSPSAISRAISNLVRNAIDHGGGKGTISVAVPRDGEITVSDEGPGIPPDQREQVFEPFYRITPRSTGAGLGLSLVKQIVANHRGEVSIENAASGTILRLSL